MSGWQIGLNNKKMYSDEREVPIDSFKLLSHPCDEGMGQMCYAVKTRFPGRIAKPPVVEVAIKDLIPVQDTLIMGHLFYLQESWKTYGPILVMEHNKKLYICDGHHRVCFAAYAKATIIEAYVVRVTIENHCLVYNGVYGIQ